MEELKRELGLIHLTSPVPEALETSTVEPSLSNSGEQLQTSMDEESLHLSVHNFIGENHVRDVILRSMNISVSDRTILPKLNTFNKKDLQRCIDEAITGIHTDNLETTKSRMYVSLLASGHTRKLLINVLGN